MKILSSLTSLGLVFGLLFYSQFALATPNHPFPQHVRYAAGTIYPNNFTQAEQDQHVRDFYDYWKRNYLVSAGSSATGQPLYRIAFGQGSDVTVSEGQGYGMVITALMAGYDPDAQRLFDGLWLFSRKYPSGIDSRLMSWKIQNGQMVSGNNSAFDGDIDIAYGLLLADKQWGSANGIDYNNEAKTVMEGILASTIGAQSRLPKLGDWADDNGGKYNQYTTRSSDFMPAHFHAFATASQDPVWNTVVLNTQAAIDAIQTNYSPVTGLLPDFIVNCQTLAQCRPADAGFLEGSHDGEYYYNAGRTPWRIGLDALLNNNAQSKAAVQKMVTWLVANTGGDINQIKAGYTLNGTGIGNYTTTFFLAPFAVAAMNDANQQNFLNALYAKIYNKHEGYYEDSVNLLSLLAITANYWNPEATGTQPPTVAACSDQIDNDGDGLIDYPNDPGCDSATDNNETDPVLPLCSDHMDNDGDGLIDYPNDPGCDSATDNDETDPSDPSTALTTTVTVNNDWGTGYCANVIIENTTPQTVDWKVDFEVDGLIENLWNAIYTQTGNKVIAKGVSWNNLIYAGTTRSFGFCAKRIAPPVVTTACSDHIDNDGDGLIDYPNDPNCDSADDNDESDSSNALDVQLEINNDWGSGYCANVIIKNISNSNIDWQVKLAVEGHINNLWNAHYTQVGQELTAEGVSWNNIVNAGEERRFGFCAQR